MATQAGRMEAMRDRQAARGLREVRLMILDARLPVVREQVARAVAALDPDAEHAALRWIESVSAFDEGPRPGTP